MSSGLLFPIANLPEGFLYQPEFLSQPEEAALLGKIRELPFAAFDFHGFTARRRVVEYGFEYDFGTRKATKTQPFAEFLLPVRERAAQFAGLSPEKLAEGIVTEYSPGTPIGWHRDAPQFETIVGISLGSSCRMRLKPYKSEGRVISVELEPRSIYVIRGAARWRLQHSIPPVKGLRYSITFRTLREAKSDVA